MIKKEKLNNALYALQALMVHARSMAHEKVDHKLLAELLDDVEELPRLIAVAEDKTDDFKSALTDLSEQYSCPYILQQFEQSNNLNGF
ncbi:hypothetical protein [Candidatus Marithrix sp. Canyon 246]|uniref:hypothetical protein n=1 Tax=Candidatus Marithrix sp. Canyon 246 TaxID=1827136 RepID=UPI00084A080A|nr:hypothetical protein [Candidatus Marithrix sp. Canyon 246]